MGSEEAEGLDGDFFFVSLAQRLRPLFVFKPEWRKEFHHTND